MERRDSRQDEESLRDIFDQSPAPEPGSQRLSADGSRSSQGSLPSGTTHRLVKRNLRQFHIWLIVISGTIGMGLFQNSGEILNIAGPGGALIAYLIVGLFVIFIMEGIAEMIGHWPIPNAMVEFVKAFVDKDLAIIVGFAYWYAYSISFATLIIAASNLVNYWDWENIIHDFVFILGVPLLLLAINCLGVLYYGNVEAVMGVLKLALVLGAFLTMCIINTRNEVSLVTDPNLGRGTVGTSYIQQGFQHNAAVTSNNARATVAAIPIVAYAYIGVEIIAVVALEARITVHPPGRNQARNSGNSLKYPAKLIAWITALIYFLSAFSYYMNVSWLDPSLPGLGSRDNAAAYLNKTQGTENSTVVPSMKTPRTNSIVVIALDNAGLPALAGFVNGCLIVAVLSAANTALYVASRTLFGLTKAIDPGSKFWGWFSVFSTTTQGRRVPAPALFISALAFCWIPFLHLAKSIRYSYQELQEIMSGIATVAVLLVWGVQCLAFIRYRKWLKQFKDTPRLLRYYPQYNHWAADNKYLPFRTMLGWAHSFPAWCGLIFCILTVFVFPTASWWNHGESHADIWATLSGPGALFVIWLALKARRYGNDFEWYVKLGNWDQLHDRLDRLTSAIVTDAQPAVPNANVEGTVGEDIEMNNRTPTPSSRPAAAGGSNYSTPRTRTGLSVGLEVDNVTDGGRRTPSPRSGPSRLEARVTEAQSSSDVYMTPARTTPRGMYAEDERDADRINVV